MSTRRQGSGYTVSGQVSQHRRAGQVATSAKSFSVISFRASPNLSRMAEQDNQEIDRALETLRRLEQN